MEEALKIHNDILFQAIQANEGKVFKIVGMNFNLPSLPLLKHYRPLLISKQV